MLREKIMLKTRIARWIAAAAAGSLLAIVPAVAGATSAGAATRPAPGMQQDAAPGMQQDAAPGMQQDAAPGMQQDAAPGMQNQGGTS